MAQQHQYIDVSSAATGSAQRISAGTDTSIDDVLELIARVEAGIEALEEAGDTSCERLRLKLREAVLVARRKLMERGGE